MTDPRNDAGPGGFGSTEAASDNNARNASSTPIVSQQGREIQPPRPIPTPGEAAWLEAGIVEGIAIGRRQVERERAAEWEALRAEVMPRIRRMVPFDALAELRGQHERAASQRATLRERGVA